MWRAGSTVVGMAARWAHTMVENWVEPMADRKERQWVGYSVGWMVVRWVEQ